MSKLKLTGRQIRAIGYPEGPVVSVAMHTMCTNFKHHTEEEALDILKQVLEKPEDYKTHEILSGIAEKLLTKSECEIPPSEGLREAAIQFNVFGQ